MATTQEFVLIAQKAQKADDHALVDASFLKACEAAADNIILQGRTKRAWARAYLERDDTWLSKAKEKIEESLAHLRLVNEEESEPAREVRRREYRDSLFVLAEIHFRQGDRKSGRAILSFAERA